MKLVNFAGSLVCLLLVFSDSQQGYSWPSFQLVGWGDPPRGELTRKSNQGDGGSVRQQSQLGNRQSRCKYLIEIFLWIRTLGIIW